MKYIWTVFMRPIKKSIINKSTYLYLKIRKLNKASNKKHIFCTNIYVYKIM